MACASPSSRSSEYYMKNKVTEKDLEMKNTVISRLQHVINEVYPGSQLCLFGSSLNGFGAKNSDADTCLWFPHTHYNDPRDPRAQSRSYDILKTIYQHMVGQGPSSPVRLNDFEIKPPSEKLPIIMCVYKRTGVSVDIGVNNTEGIVETYVQRLYTQYDYRVAPLGLIVKQWAKTHDMCEKEKGTMNSISWVLMVINYLQVGCHPPVLPVLRPRRGGWGGYPEAVRDLDIPKIRQNLRATGPQDEEFFISSARPGSSQNTTSLQELLKGFFSYYGQFDFLRRVISVRTGQVRGRQYNDDIRVFIEAPVKGDNTASRAHAHQKIKQACNRAYDLLKNGGSVYSLVQA